MVLDLSRPPRRSASRDGTAIRPEQRSWCDPHWYRQVRNPNGLATIPSPPPPRLASPSTQTKPGDQPPHAVAIVTPLISTYTRTRKKGGPHRPSAVAVQQPARKGFFLLLYLARKREGWQGECEAAGADGRRVFPALNDDKKFARIAAPNYYNVCFPMRCARRSGVPIGQ